MVADPDEHEEMAPLRFEDIFDGRLMLWHLAIGLALYAWVVGRHVPSRDWYVSLPPYSMLLMLAAGWTAFRSPRIRRLGAMQQAVVTVADHVVGATIGALVALVVGIGIILVLEDFSARIINDLPDILTVLLAALPPIAIVTGLLFSIVPALRAALRAPHPAEHPAAPVVVPVMAACILTLLSAEAALHSPELLFIGHVGSGMHAVEWPMRLLSAGLFLGCSACMALAVAWHRPGAAVLTGAVGLVLLVTGFSYLVRDYPGVKRGIGPVPIWTWTAPYSHPSEAELVEDWLGARVEVSDGFSVRVQLGPWAYSDRARLVLDFEQERY